MQNLQSPIAYHIPSQGLPCILEPTPTSSLHINRPYAIRKRPPRSFSGSHSYQPTLLSSHHRSASNNHHRYPSNMRTKPKSIFGSEVVEDPRLNYMEYRSRQGRGANNSNNSTIDGESVWDDEVEDAFFEALELFPPQGRRKINIDGKPCGRNELISKYIFMKTGKERKRKQVSSHIQVLKGLLKHDDQFMKLVIADENTIERDFDEKTISQLSGLSDAGCPSSQNKYSKRYSTASTLESQSSDSPTYRPPSQLFNSSFTINSPLTLASHGKPSLIKPYSFSMWLGYDSQDKIRYPMHHLHDYTKLYPSEHGLTSTTLSSLPEWETRFPHLLKLENEGQLNCPLIHVASSFKTMRERPENMVFWAPFEASFCNDTYFDHDFTVITRFYVSGKRLATIEEVEEPALVVTDVEGTRRVKISLNPNFWSMYFNNLVNSLTEPLKGEEDFDGEIHRRERHNKEVISNLTMVQEIFSWRSLDLQLALEEKNLSGGKTHESSRQRAAIFVWDFSKAEKGQEGVTFWRPIVIDDMIRNYPTAAPRQSLDISRQLPGYTPSIGHWNNNYMDNGNDNYAYQHHPPPLIYPETPYDETFPHHLSEPISLGSSIKYTLPSHLPEQKLSDIPVDYFQHYDQLPPFSFATMAEHPELLSQWPQLPVLAGHDDLAASIGSVQ